jgi:hypothetical protein
MVHFDLEQIQCFPFTFSNDMGTYSFLALLSRNLNIWMEVDVDVVVEDGACRRRIRY